MSVSEMNRDISGHSGTCPVLSRPHIPWLTRDKKRVNAFGHYPFVPFNGMGLVPENLECSADIPGDTRHV